MDYLNALATKDEYTTAIAKYKEVRADASFDPYESTQAEEVDESESSSEGQADGQLVEGDDTI